MIDLTDIRAGDELWITDPGKVNVCSGPARLDDKGLLYVEVFGVLVPLAKIDNGRVIRRSPGVTVVRHQPGLFEPIAANPPERQRARSAKRMMS